MNSLILTSLLTFSFGLSAHADRDDMNKRYNALGLSQPALPASLSESQAQIDLAFKNANDAKTQYEKDDAQATKLLNEYSIAVQKAQAEVTGLQSAVDGSSNYHNFWSGDSTLRAQLSAAEKKRDQARALFDGVQAHKDQAEKAHEGLLAAERAVAGKKDAANARLDLLRGAIITAKLGQKYDELPYRFKNNDDNLNEIEKQYDRTVMGAYVQDKVTQLVNSLTICKAVKRCSKNETEKVAPDFVQKELFPSSSAIRSETYDHVKDRRDSQSPAAAPAQPQSK